MVSIIDFGVFRNVRKMARLWLIAACFGVFASSPFVSLAWAAFPCEDINNNGTCDPGEKDITVELLSDGFFSTSESIVIPEDVKRLKNVNGFTLMAGQNITVASKLIAYTEGASITLLAQDGTITIGNKVALKAGKGGSVDISAGQDVVFGHHASAKSSMVMVYSEAGNVLLMEKTKLFAQDYVDIVGLGGGVYISPGSRLSSKEGSVSVLGAQNVVVNSSRVVTEDLTVYAAHVIDFQNNLVRLASTDGSVVYLITEGSTVNMCGTVFKKLAPNNLIIQGNVTPCN